VVFRRASEVCQRGPVKSVSFLTKFLSAIDLEFKVKNAKSKITMKNVKF
jgi:hypothetical protein